MLDIVTIGHSTIDFFLKLDPAKVPLLWLEEKKDSFLALDFADKTPVQSIHWSLGGNAVNTGIGLARLGVRVDVISDVGDDIWGKLVGAGLSRENISLKWLRTNPGEVTDLSVVLVLRGERTILSYHYPREYYFPDDFPLCRWIYLTSLGEHFFPFHKKLLDYLKDSKVNLAYNPGVFELEAGVERNRQIIENCEVLILNREEAGELISERPAEVDERLLREVHKFGCKVVVVTDGEKGAYTFDGQELVWENIYPAKRVEMTGAGDAFSAGFLAALIKGRKIKEALRWGNVNSASVIQEFGGVKGLLTREELEKRVYEL